MSRRKANPQAQVSIGWPILPHGITVTVTVAMSDIGSVTHEILEWAKREESVWKTLPTAGPDVVPGGSPVHMVDDVDWMDARKVGF